MEMLLICVVFGNSMWRLSDKSINIKITNKKEKHSNQGRTKDDSASVQYRDRHYRGPYPACTAKC